MSAVLTSWCERVRLSRRVAPDSLERDFANGFLFGELLLKHNQLPAAAAALVRDDSRADAVVANYAALEPTFARLGVRLSARTVARLVAREPGVAQGLLYGLKTHLAVFERVVTGRPRADGGLALAKLQPKLPKPLYETLSARVFESVLKKIVDEPQTQRQRDMAAFLSRFNEADHLAAIDDYNRAVLDSQRAYYADFRGQRRARMRDLNEAERRATEAGARQWGANQTLRHAEERNQRYAAARAAAAREARARALTGADERSLEDGTRELVALAAVRGIDADPRGAALEAQRAREPQPTSALRRDEYIAELAARLGPEGGAQPMPGRGGYGASGPPAIDLAASAAGGLQAAASAAVLHAATYRASAPAAAHT